MLPILSKRALLGETEVLAVLNFLPTSLNVEPPPPMWVASAVIGQVASRLLSLYLSIHLYKIVYNVYGLQ